MPLTKDVLTPQEVAEYLQLTPDTVYRYIREGKLVASKPGRTYRIPRRMRSSSSWSPPPAAMHNCALSPDSG